MSHRDDLERIVASLPTGPGVYIMKDETGGIIYIGKASSLRKRVSSYFQKKDHDPKTSLLVKTIRGIECIVTDNEIEALILESTLIKKHRPKYNIRLKDDKRYPYIAVTLGEEFPRVIVTRRILDNGSRYFGPYTDARAARNTVEMINSIFRLKRCKNALPLKKNERPCLNDQIGRCVGPCRGTVQPSEYREIVMNVIEFLQGRVEPVLENLNAMMLSFSDKMLYERASQIRDMIYDMQKVVSEQKVSVPIGTDTDYLAAAIFGSEALLVLFEFRKGVLISRKISVYDNARYSATYDVLSNHILTRYETADIPGAIICSDDIEDRALIQEYLTGRAGHRVTVRKSLSPDEHSIIRLIMRNIDVIASERKAGRERTLLNEGLEELRHYLHLEAPPDRIECVDISNLQGTDSVASLVTFIDGEAARSQYRRYKIHGYEGANDPGMIHEVISRRLQYLMNEKLELPDLIVVDGGPTQLSRAMEARDNLNVSVAIISLAKRLEEIYVDPGGPPLLLERGSPALQILTGIRDEAHRFAITYHRKLRDRRTTASELDSAGISESTRKALLAYFKSVEKIKSAGVDELERVPGIGKKRAIALYERMHRD